MSCVVSCVDKGLRRSAFFLAILSALSLTAILVVIVVSVILRKFFNTPLFFTEELVGLLMSACLFLALPMATIHGQHIKVNLFVDFIKNRAPLLVKPLSVISILFGIAFMGWMFWEALPWMDFAIRRELKTQTARILLYPLMTVVPVSVGLCCLIYCAQLFGLIKIKEQ